MPTRPYLEIPLDRNSGGQSRDGLPPGPSKSILKAHFTVLMFPKHLTSSVQSLKSHNLNATNGLQLSQSYAMKLGLKAGDKVAVQLDSGAVVESVVVIDNGMEGEFAALGVAGLDYFGLFMLSRYANASIKAL